MKSHEAKARNDLAQPVPLKAAQAVYSPYPSTASRKMLPYSKRDQGTQLE